MKGRKLTRLYPLIALFLFFGCTDKYGQIGENLPKVTVRDAVLQPDLVDREVRLEGKIITQCLSNGCWFILQDNTGKMVVDLKFLNLGLPQRTGKKVVVTGIVNRQEDGQVIISARGLIIS